ncbi:hypothetical protein TNCV_4436521 [Trichonephila clavipes]|nr:hypothetical protein TNCV_4436521 [Trichonephila clavipes]
MKRAYRFLTLQQFKKAKLTELVNVINLEGQMTATANRYTTKWLPEILQEVNIWGLMFHYDNASSLTA